MATDSVAREAGKVLIVLGSHMQAKIHRLQHKREGGTLGSPQVSTVFPIILYHSFFLSTYLWEKYSFFVCWWLAP